MSFSKQRKKYENDFLVGRLNSSSKAEYDAENMGNLLSMPESYPKYAALKKFEATDSKNIKKVFSCLKDPAEIVRYGAVRCLARIESKQAEAHLRQALQDDSCHVRSAALEVIKEKGSAEFYSAVDPLLVDKSYSVRLAAAITMQKIDEYEPHIHLINLLEDPSKQNRLKAIEMLARDFDLIGLGHIYLVSKTDKDQIVRAQAARVIDSLLENGVLQRVREYIFRKEAENDLEEVLFSLLLVDNDQATNLVRDILASRLMEVDGLDSEREADLFSAIADEFVARYKKTKESFYVDDLLNAIGLFSHNYEVEEDLTRILATSGSQYVLQQAVERLLYEWQYDFPLKIILSMGGVEALDTLNEFFEQDGGDLFVQFVFEDQDNTKRLLQLITQVKSASGPALAVRLLDQDFFEQASDEIKKLCLAVAGKARTKKLVPRIAEIFLSPEEGMLVRRKAALALGEIQGSRAIKALEKLQKDDTASGALKDIAKKMLAQLS